MSDASTKQRLTVVFEEPPAPDVVQAIARAFGVPSRWLAPGRALGLEPTGDPMTLRARALALAEERGLAVALTPERPPPPRLFLADMDSTIIPTESLDALAAERGVGEKVAAITRRSMAGELDFEASFRERIALLAGTEWSAIAAFAEAHVALRPGAAELVAALKAANCRCVLVTGGFAPFMDLVAAKAGFDRAVGNVLAVENGALTGGAEGAIVDAAAKARVLEEERAALGCSAAATIAIGDGANDRAMLERAGLGVAMIGKPTLKAMADAWIEADDIEALRHFVDL